jgi:hypothetical protein
MVDKLDMIECSTCDGPMPKLRKELYGYSFCVKCSTVLPKVGRVVTYGQGEEIWNDVEILDQEAAKRILELEQFSGKKLEYLELLDYNQDSSDQSDSKYKEIGAVRELMNSYGPLDFDYIQDEPDSELDEDGSTEAPEEDIIGYTHN